MKDPRVRIAPNVSSASAERVIELLDSVRPVVRVGRDVETVATGAAAALVSMLARLFPHTIVQGPTIGPSPWPAKHFDELIDSIKPSIPSASRGSELDVEIAIGDTGRAAEFFLGGDDWTAVVSRTPVDAKPTRLGLGLHAAAVILAAEVMKSVLGPHGLIHRRIEQALVWNLFDYKLQAASTSGGAMRPLDIAVLGGGSVGSSLVGVLCCNPLLTGSAVVVDKDTFDPARNPFRYPIATGSETGPKSAWLASLLSARGWTARAVNGTVAEWVAANSTPGFDGIVVSSVDRVEGRLEVADVLARTTLSVGVSDLALHLQREVLGDGFACPYCDFVDVGPSLGQLDRYKAMTGIGEERLVLLLMGTPLSAEDVRAAVAAQKIRAEGAEDLIGRRVDDLVGRSYAEASVPMQGEAPVSVTAPFVSWMGGVLSAAELAKSALGFPGIDRRIDLDLAGLPTGLVYQKRASSSRCVCACHIRRKWMKQLYSTI